jgi:putative oxidoreductase
MSVFSALRNVPDDLRASRPVDSVVQLGLRLGLAGVFWASARTKVEGLLAVSDNTAFLFAEEYRLPLIDPVVAAHLATYAEHAFALLLALGLASRPAALGLFVMTAVIQIFVYPDALMSTHLGWLAMAAAIVLRGPGRFSLDAWIAGRVR